MVEGDGVTKINLFSPSLSAAAATTRFCFPHPPYRMLQQGLKTEDNLPPLPYLARAHKNKKQLGGSGVAPGVTLLGPAVSVSPSPFSLVSITLETSKQYGKLSGYSSTSDKNWGKGGKREM